MGQLPARLPLLAFAFVIGGCADRPPRPGDGMALRVDDRVTLEGLRHGRQLDVANALA